MFFDAGEEDSRQEKGTTENEVVGWHHQLDGHEFEHAWKIPWTEEPGGLQSMGSLRVGHD